METQPKFKGKFAATVLALWVIWGVGWTLFWTVLFFPIGILLGIVAVWVTAFYAAGIFAWIIARNPHLQAEAKVREEQEIETARQRLRVVE